MVGGTVVVSAGFVIGVALAPALISGAVVIVRGTILVYPAFIPVVVVVLAPLVLLVLPAVVLVVVRVEGRSGARRVGVTSCKDALNGYQKGRCFYCSAEISVSAADGDPKGAEPCEVDHFFPHTLFRFLPAGHANLDGIWNLVLSCRSCNRGKDGKAAAFRG